MHKGDDGRYQNPMRVSIPIIRITGIVDAMFQVENQSPKMVQGSLFEDAPLSFDMGILLTFMFLWNMVGALVLIPALAAFLLRNTIPAEATS